MSNCHRSKKSVRGGLHAVRIDMRERQLADVGVGMTCFWQIRPVAVSQAGIASLSRPNTIALFAITTPSARP